MISDDPISSSERTRSSVAGITYEQSARVYVDRDDYDELMIYVPKTMAQVALSDCDSTYLWGDEELPVTMTITPHLNKYILELSRNSASSLFKK